MENKNAKLKITVTGQIATFFNKTDEEIIGEIVKRVPEVENYKNYIQINRKGDQSNISLKDGFPKILAPKIKLAFLQP